MLPKFRMSQKSHEGNTLDLQPMLHDNASGPTTPHLLHITLNAVLGPTRDPRKTHETRVKSTEDPDQTHQRPTEFPQQNRATSSSTRTSRARLAHTCLLLSSVQLSEEGRFRLIWTTWLPEVRHWGSPRTRDNQHLQKTRTQTSHTFGTKSRQAAHQVNMNSDHSNRQSSQNSEYHEESGHDLAATPQSRPHTASLRRRLRLTAHRDEQESTDRQRKDTANNEKQIGSKNQQRNQTRDLQHEEIRTEAKHRRYLEQFQRTQEHDPHQVKKKETLAHTDATRSTDELAQQKQRPHGLLQLPTNMFHPHALQTLQPTALQPTPANSGRTPNT